MHDKYGHCWQCGTKRVVGARPRTTSETTSVPQFASYEEMAKVPKRRPFLLRVNPVTRLFWFLVLAGLFKFFASPFLGKYGTYIVIVASVLGLIVILWRYFRRDPTEGVGVKLN